MIKGFAQLGMPEADSMAAAEVTPELLADPDARVSHEQLWALWLTAQKAMQDPVLGLHLAETVGPSDYGILGYIVASSMTVRESFTRLRRYHRLLADAVHYSLEETDRGYLLKHEIEGGGAVPGPVAEYVLAAPLRLMHQILGEAPSLDEVRFAGPTPPDTSEYERVFQAPIRFDCGENRLAIRVSLDSPVPGADATLTAALESYADERVDQLPENRSLPVAVRNAVARALPDGVPMAEHVGKELALSPRTLRRRLREAGTSVSEIVADVRRQLALKYLRSGELSVSEIAYMLGFAEPAAFHRAFKRWEGCTPLEHRRQMRG